MPKTPKEHVFNVRESLWILNGARNRAFYATIEDIDLSHGIITVQNRDERNSTWGKLLEFNSDTLEAHAPGVDFKGGLPRLVPKDDPRAQEIESRRKHREFREAVNEAANEFKDDPTAETYRTLLETVEAWGVLSVGRNMGDSIETALRRRGIFEE